LGDIESIESETERHKIEQGSQKPQLSRGFLVME